MYIVHTYKTDDIHILTIYLQNNTTVTDHLNINNHIPYIGGYS